MGSDASRPTLRICRRGRCLALTPVSSAASLVSRAPVGRGGSVRYDTTVGTAAARQRAAAFATCAHERDGGVSGDDVLNTAGVTNWIEHVEQTVVYGDGSGVG